MKLSAYYYQQFDANPTLDVPGEGYGGWREAEIEIAPERTALVVMHAWDMGTQDQYPDSPVRGVYPQGTAALAFGFVWRGGADSCDAQ